MLSGLLKNDIAINVSIGIMNAFVEMRKILAAYGSVFERLSRVEYTLLEYNEKFKELFDLIQLPSIPKQGVFMQGQIYDAFKLVEDIIKSATSSITIIDNYADDTVLGMLAKKASGVAATIITDKPNKMTQQNITKFNQQYPSVEVIEHKGFHDRFIVIDDATVRLVGGSLKDLGKKCFGIAAIEENEPRQAMLQKVQTILQAAQSQQP
jgi:hypothetical protein